MTSIPFINIHAHCRAPRADEYMIYNASFDEADLDFPYSLGIHPMLATEQELENHFQQIHKACKRT